MEFSKRFLALGDSFSEGMGDIDQSRPNEVRGWADRVAEQLCVDPGWGYANLAIRGKKTGQVVAEQLSAALELKPTLATLYMGANDILRPKIDIDALMVDYRKMALALAETGATLLLFTGFDTGGSGIFSSTRGRTAIYNEAVREIADEAEATVADYWRWREFRDWRYWSSDRLHMNSAGHTLMASKVLAVLEHQTRIEVPELPAVTERSRSEKLREDAAWAKEHLMPWVKRRMTGTSSGDHLSARFPDYVSLEVAQSPQS